MYRKSSKPLISAQEINERLDTLGKDVAAFGCDIVITVLSGGFIFSADVCKRIASPKLQLAFIRASSYGSGTESSGSLKITGLENMDIRGKKVLVIDDILDTGNTMFGIKQALAGMGAKEITFTHISRLSCTRLNWVMSFSFGTPFIHMESICAYCAMNVM